MWTNDARPILVLGLGNPIMGDDGVGLVALERLRERCELSEGVELVDGGTWGMNLLPDIEVRGNVAAASTRSAPGSAPGADRRARAGGAAPVLGPEALAAPGRHRARCSPLAQLRGTLPAMTVAFGVAAVDRSRCAPS